VNTGGSGSAGEVLAEESAFTAGDLVLFLDQYPPAQDADADEWILWHELIVDLWRQIRAEHPFLIDAASYVIAYHARRAACWQRARN